MNDLIIITLKVVTLIALLLNAYLGISGAARARVYSFGVWYTKKDRPFWMAVLSHFLLVMFFSFLLVKVYPSL